MKSIKRRLQVLQLPFAAPFSASLVLSGPAAACSLADSADSIACEPSFFEEDNGTPVLTWCCFCMIMLGMCVVVGGKHNQAGGM